MESVVGGEFALFFCALRCAPIMSMISMLLLLLLFLFVCLLVSSVPYPLFSLLP